MNIKLEAIICQGWGRKVERLGRHNHSWDGIYAVIQLLIFTSYSFFNHPVQTAFLIGCICGVVLSFGLCVLVILLLINSCLCQRAFDINEHWSPKWPLHPSLFRAMSFPTLSSQLLSWVLSYNSFVFVEILKAHNNSICFLLWLKTLNLFSNLGPKILLIRVGYSHIAAFNH